MEESFEYELLSSMSPKVKHCQKHFRKGTTVLALKKSIRRSSIYDKSIHTINNEKLLITEVSSTTTTESSRNSSSSYKQLLKTNPIIIDDSDSDSNELISSQPYVIKDEKYSSLSKDKVKNIEQWIDTVNNQSEVKDTTTQSGYSELSTIYGEENGTNFITERTGRAVNSTVNGSIPMHFDELFTQKMYKPVDPKKYDTDSDEVLVIDESYIESEKSLIKEAYQIDKYENEPSKTNNLNSPIKDKRSSNESMENYSDDSFSFPNESLTKRLNFKNNSANKCTEDINSSIKNNIDKSVNNEENTQGNLNCTDDELASMLDDIYGEGWREKKEHVLPKSEPRKQATRLNNIHTTNTERKPKLSISYKNPYLETENSKTGNLLQTLQRQRLKNSIKFSTANRLNNLCDSDTDSHNSDTDSHNSDKIMPRRKLTFTNFDCDDDVHKTLDRQSNASNVASTKKITSKYFKSTIKNVPDKIETESDKENLDEFSFLGQSLKDRIQKKVSKKKSDCKVIRENESSECKPASIEIGKGDCNKVPKKISSKTEKTTKINNRKLSTSSISSDDEWQNEIDKIVNEHKTINGKYSFLASLSGNIPILQCDVSARLYRNNFKLYKDRLLKKLFDLYNEQVFENAIPHDTVLVWNDRMRGSAGFCYCKKITRRTGAVERTVKIALSTKVIDEACRLRDTLIHEMCHAATWIVNCVSDGHGPYWKSWAYKAMKTFPELPPIKRCHDYVINTKYTYNCTGCGYSIGRHTKSLDIERKRCGYCMGKFEVLLNKVSKKGEKKSVPATPKKEASGFALFVKENYGVYKQPNLKHGDVMKLLGQKFQEMKLKPS